MTDLAERATELEQQIENASPKERLALLPAFDRVIATLTAHGETVPTRLRRLNTTLKEEAIEDLFDNMPV
ncbi:hypothetical protein ROLI_040730 [Roseobacter fucihabitans]|uniref:Uncharacterized protein n=1 Tax=Roseobacter fucihabitans TaxID=1537242 RepID=A0ABZ2BYK5_9RHOB|nr:hypothetical protein [Roseobacter litoralis]MBC6965147.1 hypothetical protein [Roseobacter litoralis]MBC6965850.1 hypothetical protein [Roseobacter litoralis]